MKSGKKDFLRKKDILLKKKKKKNHNTNYQEELSMHQYRVQIWTKNHGMIETIISARSVGLARSLAQEQYPDARIGCVTQID